MFDTHCHLTNDALFGALEPVLQAAAQAGVHGMLTVSTDVDDAHRAMAVANDHAQVWCTAGVHPSEAGRDHELAGLQTVAEHPKCLAWGELGLDNYWPEPSQDRQLALLEAELEFIRAWDANGGRAMPIVVHCRKALNDLLPRLQHSGINGSRFVFHCFTDGPDEAQRILDFGAAISFTGVVTYPNAADIATASDLVSMNRLMIETDAPYLSPQPVRKVRPNQPAHVRYTAEFLAARRGLTLDDFTTQADATARTIYGFPPGSFPENSPVTPPGSPE